MEHILNISFDFDTQNVKRIVEEQASRQIIGDIQRNVEETMFHHRNYWMDKEVKKENRTGLSDFLVERLDVFLKENRNALLEMAAKRLADKVSRTKAFKDGMGAAMEGSDNA